jgi:alpha-aminoadipic semialdehyde synthase
MYEDLDAMKEAMKRVSKGITKGGLPKKQHPIVFGVTGSGRVSSGALEILELLPHHYVSPPELCNYLNSIKDSHQNSQRIIICQFEVKHLFELKDQGTGSQEFDKADFYANPHMYRSVFAERYLKHITFLIHGIYYEAKYPRILTIDELKNA